MQSDDPDFAQRMHFMGPPGHKPCTREWPHDGPCAHPMAGSPTEWGHPGKWICLDWYDGPLIEIAKVSFEDGHSLIEVNSFGWVDEYDEDKTHMRFSREDLQKMIDLLDGKPVENHNDEMETG